MKSSFGAATTGQRLPASVGVAALIALLTLGGCSTGSTEDSTPDRSSIRIGLLPVDSASELEFNYELVVAHLAAELDRPIEISVPSSYEDLLDDFDSQQVDIAVFGGLTYLTARERSDAVPLLMRDIDVRFITAFITQAENAGDSLQDFSGKRLSFGSRLSTSGHLMPRRYLNDQIGEEVEDFFSEVIFSGAHDRTVGSVASGRVDLGAVDAQVLSEMIETGRVDMADLAVVVNTPPYADYVWAVQPSMDPELQSAILTSLVSLSAFDESGSEILDRLGAEGFLPANDSDFEQLRETAESLDLLEASS